MQPICSLRVNTLKFKHAPVSLGLRHVLHQRQGSCAPQHKERPAHGPAHHKLPPRIVKCSDAVVPDIPFPGDNQSAGAWAALTSHDEASDSRDETADSSTRPSSSGAPSPPPDDKRRPRIPHRWRIVGMMALAFVLCNMDKVQHMLLHVIKTTCCNC